MQTYVNLSDNQRETIGRCIEFFVGGLRITASKHVALALKREYLDNNFTMLSHDKVTQQKQINVGKKASIVRDKIVTVTKTDPCEAILLKANDLICEQKLLPEYERYREPFLKDDRFQDSIGWNFSFDKGGNSFKGVVSCVNVDKPQGQRHVIPILEFGGVKDIDNNVRTAGFKRGDFVRKGLQAVIGRHCISVKLTVNGETRLLLVKNTSKSHDRNAPRAISQSFFGLVEHTPLQTETEEAVHFHNRMPN